MFRILATIFTTHFFLRHKRAIKVITLCLLIIVGTWIAHNEYLVYIALSDSKEGLTASFIIKWIIILTAIVCAYLYTTSQKNDVKKTVETSLEKTHIPVDEALDDIDEALLTKPTLKSKSDNILDKYK